MKKLFLFPIFLSIAYAKLPFKIKGEIPNYILKQIEQTYTNETPTEVSEVISNIPTFKAIYDKKSNTIYVLRTFYIKKIKIKKIPKDFDKNLLISFLILQKYTKYTPQKKEFLKLYIKEILKAFGYKVQKITIKDIYNGKAVTLEIYIDAKKIKQKKEKTNLREKFKNFLSFLKTLIKEKPKVKKEETGNKQKRVGLIIFYGIDRTPVNSFNSVILLKPGEPFSKENLSKTINLLYSSGYFFSIRTKKVETKDNIHLIFDIRDAPRYKIKTYFGYNFLYGPIFNFNLKTISPFRKGNIYSFNIKYQKNRLFDIILGKEKNFLSLQLEYKQEKLSDVTSKTTSLYAQKRIFTPYTTLYPEIGLAYKSVPEEDLSRVYMYFNLGIERKNLDSSIYPTKGYILRFSTKYMFSLDLYYNIIKFIPKFVLFIPLKEQIFTYHITLSSGVIKNLSSTEDTTEYFYLGGFDSLRGFDYKTIGPAKYFFNIQNDLVYRLRDKIFLGPFLDYAIAKIEKNNFYASSGLELGFITPLGDILLYGAYKIKEDDVYLGSFKDRLSLGFIVGLSF